MQGFPLRLCVKVGGLEEYPHLPKMWQIPLPKIVYPPHKHPSQHNIPFHKSPLTISRPTFLIICYNNYVKLVFYY